MEAAPGRAPPISSGPSPPDLAAAVDAGWRIDDRGPVVVLFAAAVLLEVGGAADPAGVQEDRGWAWIGAGVVALGVYGFVASQQPDARFGRILAGYVLMVVVGAAAWATVADDFAPGRWYVGGALVLMLGVALLMYGPRPPAADAGRAASTGPQPSPRAARGAGTGAAAPAAPPTTTTPRGAPGASRRRPRPSRSARGWCRRGGRWSSTAVGSCSTSASRSPSSSTRTVSRSSSHIRATRFRWNHAGCPQLCRSVTSGSASADRRASSRSIGPSCRPTTHGAWSPCCRGRIRAARAGRRRDPPSSRRRGRDVLSTGDRRSARQRASTTARATAA